MGYPAAINTTKFYEDLAEAVERAFEQHPAAFFVLDGFEVKRDGMLVLSIAGPPFSSAEFSSIRVKYADRLQFLEVFGRRIVGNGAIVTPPGEQRPHFPRSYADASEYHSLNHAFSMGAVEQIAAFILKVFFYHAGHHLPRPSVELRPAPVAGTVAFPARTGIFAAFRR